MIVTNKVRIHELCLLIQNAVCHYIYSGHSCVLWLKLVSFIYEPCTFLVYSSVKVLRNKQGYFFYQIFKLVHAYLYIAFSLQLYLTEFLYILMQNSRELMKKFLFTNRNCFLSFLIFTLSFLFSFPSYCLDPNLQDSTDEQRWRQHPCLFLNFKVWNDICCSYLGYCCLDFPH